MAVGNYQQFVGWVDNLKSNALEAHLSNKIVGFRCALPNLHVLLGPMNVSLTNGQAGSTERSVFPRDT